MPDQKDIDSIFSKLEQLYESKNKTEMLLIRIDEKLRTVTERGCQQGETMNKELRKDLTAEIEKTNKKIDAMQKLYNKIAGLSTVVGMGIGAWFKHKG